MDTDTTGNNRVKYQVRWVTAIYIEGRRYVRLRYSVQPVTVLLSNTTATAKQLYLPTLDPTTAT